MPNEHPTQIEIYREASTKRAAALATIGVEFISELDHERVVNIYTEARPYEEGKPGEITYLLKTTGLAGHKTKELADSYDTPGYGKAQALDNLVEEICQASPVLGARLKTLLPLALLDYLRGYNENRERIVNLWRKAIPFVRVKNASGFWTLISRKASRETRERLGVH